MVANALWGRLQQQKKSNWQRRGEPIWAAALWQDIAARIENMTVPRSRVTEEHQNNEQVDKAAKIGIAQVDLDWERKGLYSRIYSPMDPRNIRASWKGCRIQMGS